MSKIYKLTQESKWAVIKPTKNSPTKVKSIREMSQNDIIKLILKNK